MLPSICSKLTIKTAQQTQMRCAGVFIINPQQIQHNNASFRVLDFAYKFECFSIYMKITTKKSNFSLKTIIESKKKEIKYETIICERFDV